MGAANLADAPYRNVCRFLRYKHPIRKITILIITILMPFKLGIEVDFDVEFFIFLGDNNAVHQQAEVGVADGSFLNDLLD